MITLYTFGPYFGLPDGSPFVTKAMLLLKFAGLEYSEDRGGYRKAPKGKLPYKSKMTALSLPIRPSSAFTSRKNTVLISMPVARRSKRLPLGQSKKCAKSTFTSRR
jgi:hypothetical protein